MARPERKGRCRACRGTGYEGCKKCGGSGSSRVIGIVPAYGKKIVRRSQTCDTCRGTGNGAKCSKCRGTGVTKHGW